MTLTENDVWRQIGNLLLIKSNDVSEQISIFENLRDAINNQNREEYTVAGQ